MTEQSEWKKVYHLVGEQTIPVYQAAIQFPQSVPHYLLCTDRTKKAAENLKKVLQKNGYSAEVHSLGDEKISTSFNGLAAQLYRILEETNPKHELSLFDITGGTKPMSLTSFMLANKMSHVKCAYLNSYERVLQALNHNDNILLEHKLKIQDFIELCGCRLSKTNVKEISKNTIAAAEFLHEYSREIQMAQNNFASCNDNKLDKKAREAKFAKTEDKFLKSLPSNAVEGWKKLWSAFCSEKGNGDICRQASFLSGGWYEYYTYNQLRNSMGEDTEILLNTVIEFNNEPNKSAQEFDILFSDGYSLVILECKAGKVTQEYIQKLENLRDTFSGALGKSALVTLNPSSTKNNKKESFAIRIQNSRGIAAFCGKNALNELCQHGVNFKIGKIYGE